LIRLCKARTELSMRAFSRGHWLHDQEGGHYMAQLFSVIEYSSFFALRHNPSGDEHPLGDGVDALFDSDGKVLVPGTPGFVHVWTEVLNTDARTTLEAYFPQRLEE
jgi:hypothetical protein